MRIALIGNDMYPQFPLRGYGGIESSVETLAWGLHRDGRDFFCVVPSGGVDASSARSSYPFEILRTRARASVLSRSAPESFATEAREIVRGERPDAIWAQSLWSARLLSTLDIPTIITIQDSGPGEPENLLERPSIAYRFISWYQYRNWVRADALRRRAFMAYTSLGDEEYDFHSSGGDSYLWVGGLGWGFEGKGLDTFLDLARRNPEKRFVAYASGRRAQLLRARWASLRVRNFHFMGELVRGRAHREAFRNARALIMPTRLMEALGRTVIESLSKGTPVLGSGNGALPELINGVNGVATNDFEELNAALDVRFDRRTCYLSSERFHVRHEVDRLSAVTAQLLRGTFHGELPTDEAAEAGRP